MGLENIHIDRLEFGYYPTPIEELTRLRENLISQVGACPRIFIKRDDYTGPGFGGNKVRKLEFVLAKALADGARAAITTGGMKSNHARVTAAMCARIGLRCILVLNPAAISFEGLDPASLYLDRLYGAEIVEVRDRDSRAPAMEAIAERLRREGVETVVIPLGASIPLGALGFIRAAREAKEQIDSAGLRISRIFHSSSSGGTQAGLVAGSRIHDWRDLQIVGVSPDDPAASIESEVKNIIRGLEELLDLPAGEPGGEVKVIDQYIGPGYGIPSPESEAATELLARTEGVILDPVYTSKAMACMLDWIRTGRISPDENILFWYTGGQMAHFYAPAHNP